MKIAPSYLFIVLFFFLFVLLVYSSVLIVNNVCLLRRKNAAIKFICGLALFVLFQCLFTCLRLHTGSVDDLNALVIYASSCGTVFCICGISELVNALYERDLFAARYSIIQYFFIGVICVFNGALVIMQLVNSYS